MPTAVSTKEATKKSTQSTHHTKSPERSGSPSKPDEPYEFSEGLSPEELEFAKKSSQEIEVKVSEQMTVFSTSLAEIKPSGLTTAEVAEEAARREKLKTAAEVYTRSDLRLKAAGRKVGHASFELGEQLAEFRKFYKAERTWGAVKIKLAEGLGYKGQYAAKKIDRMIETYERQKSITRWERVIAGRLGYSLTPDLVKELLTMQLKDGECTTEKEAHLRVTLAHKKAEAAKGHEESRLRTDCFDTLLRFFKTLDPDARKEQMEQLGEEVESTLAEELKDEPTK